MAISSTTRRWDFTANGSQTAFAYTTRITDEDHLRVIVRDDDGVEEVQTITTDYTVSGVGNATGGNVTFVTAPTNAYHVTIAIVEPHTQTQDIRNQGQFYPETHENAFDHFIRIDQEQQDAIDRSARLPESVTPATFDMKFPANLVGKADALAITNSTGDGWADGDDWPTADGIADAEANALAAAASAAAAAASASASAVSSGTLSPYGINNLGLSASVAANALTISMKEADGTSNPSTGTDSVTIYFRSATATTGSMTARSVTSSLSITVPSGGTLGHNDALADYVYIYAIDNAGTVELAVSSSCHWDEGQTFDTTTIGTGSDDAATLYSTTGRSGVAIRLIGRLLSTQATAGTWASAITRLETGFLSDREHIVMARAANFNAKHGVIYEVSTASARSVQLPTPRAGLWGIIKDSTGSAQTNPISLVRAGSESIETAAATYSCNLNKGSWFFWSNGTNWFIRTNHDVRNDTHSEVIVYNGNGHGSTNNKIRRMSATGVNTGAAITYADSAANGASFTINKTGIYSIHYSDKRTATAAGEFGITVNAAALTTAVGSIGNYTAGLRALVTGPATNKPGQCSWTGKLTANDIVRPHTDGLVDDSGDHVMFGICLVKELV